MSSHATTYSTFHLHRARVFFLARNTQQVERHLAREIARALVALLTLTAWVLVIMLVA
jgi:hypothetical protein